MAYLTDVVANGCWECAFDSARVELWPVDEPVTSTGAAARIIEAPPAISIAAVDNYSTEVPPGQYLLCVRPSCTNVRAALDETATVNIKLRFGPTSFFQIDPVSRRFVEDFGISLEP